MKYKKTALSIIGSLMMGTIATAQPSTLELTPNSVIAYFSSEGDLLPNREGSEYYRYFNNIVSGCYLVQDFYSKNDQRQTDPICFTDPAELQSWFPESLLGPLTFWDEYGQKIQSGYANQDGGRSGTWTTWNEFGHESNYELINGELILSYFDMAGNRVPTPSEGGNFRTLIEYDSDNDLYLIADYYTNTRTRQMDPVLIKRDDLLRWDIQYRDGNFTYYNLDGDLVTMENYENNQLHGPVTHWYEGVFPAQKFEERHFVNHQLEGLYTRWYTNGYPKVRIELESGQIANIQCWDNQFSPLDSSLCIKLLDNTLGAELPNDDMDTQEDAIEIIIPDDVTSSDDEVILEVEEITEDSNSATVIFPQTDAAAPDTEESEEIFDDAIPEEDIFLSEDAIILESENTEPQTEPEPTEGQKILRSINNILKTL